MARRLANAGHDVELAGWREIDDAALDHPYHRLRADERAVTRSEEAIAERGWLRSIPTTRRLRRELIDATEIEDLVAQVSPDLVIIDVEVHTAVIAIHRLGRPVLLRSPFNAMYRRWTTPPLHSPAAPPETMGERAVVALTWCRTFAGRLLRQIVGERLPKRIVQRTRPFRYGTTSRIDLRDFARARSVRLGELTSRFHWLGPHLYPSLPMISTTAAELDVDRPPRDDGREQRVGPMVRIPPDGASEPGSDRFHEFLEHSGDAAPPIVYCALGTMSHEVQPTVTKVIDAATHEDGWRLVVGLGGRVPPEAFDPCPPHVLLLDDAPQREILRHASLAIVHGGINSINECAVTGVPMLVASEDRTDQPGNTARVVHAGFGRKIDIGALTAEQLGTVVTAALHDRELADRAAEIGELVARYERDAVFEQIVSDLLGSS